MTERPNSSFSASFVKLFLLGTGLKAFGNDAAPLWQVQYHHLAWGHLALAGGFQLKGLQVSQDDNLFPMASVLVA